MVIFYSEPELSKERQKSYWLAQLSFISFICFYKKIKSVVIVNAMLLPLEILIIVQLTFCFICVTPKKIVMKNYIHKSQIKLDNIYIYLNYIFVYSRKYLCRDLFFILSGYILTRCEKYYFVFEVVFP